ncbi:MAG: TIGR01777 family oxidoreductase [Acidimicrobiia bacterium]
MRVLITGSHGLIGGALAAALRRDGHHVTPVVRDRLPSPGEASWDPNEGTADAAAMEGHDAAVHLAGAGIGDHRWTRRYKEQVLGSRTRGTTLLATTLARLDRPPAVLVSGSAVGFYGDRGDDELTEDCGPGAGFLAEVVRRWEASTAPAEEAGIRVVHTRSGVVQSPEGGALGRLLLPFRLGVGGRWGSGRQWLSWVHIDDEVGAIRHAIETAGLRGPVNVTSPHPVRVGDYARALGRAVRRPAVLPTPTLALYALLGRQLTREMLLAGQRVVPARLEATGYTFRHPHIDQALADCVG